MTNSAHQHTIQHWPADRSGYGVCDCGATQRVVHGTPVGDWHACSLCVANAPGLLESSPLEGK